MSKEYFVACTSRLSEISTADDRFILIMQIELFYLWSSYCDLVYQALEAFFSFFFCRTVANNCVMNNEINTDFDFQIQQRTGISNKINASTKLALKEITQSMKDWL